MIGFGALLLLHAQQPEFKIVETPPPPPVAAETSPPIAPGGPVVQVPRLDPTAALRRRGFSDAGIRIILNAARARDGLAHYQPDAIARLKRSLLAEISSEAPDPDRIGALLREALSLSSDVATKRADQTIELLRALPQGDLKIYLGVFGPDVPNLIRLSIPGDR